MAELSIIAFGDGVCINDHERNPYGSEKYGLCAYCSGSNCWNKSNAIASQTKDWADWEKLEEVLSTNQVIKSCIETGEILTWNVWGANPDTPFPIADGLDSPLERSQAIVDFCVSFSEKYKVPHYQFFVSTNGFWLNDKRVQDFYQQNKNMHLQLSYDGLGNYVRQGKFDPLFDKETGPILADFARRGIFDLINVTMTKQNNSLFANVALINKWRADNHLLNIETLSVKLNHINDSTYCDHWNFEGNSLSTYMDELERICFMIKYGKDVPNNSYWKPYISYFLNQCSRWDPYIEDNACGKFSIFANGQDEDDPVHHATQDWNWSINTLGEYVVCQLIDKASDVPNPHLRRPAKCEKCEYGWMNECHPCPDNSQKEDCHYKREYARMQLRFKMFDELYGNTANHDTCSCSRESRYRIIENN